MTGLASPKEGVLLRATGSRFGDRVFFCRDGRRYWVPHPQWLSEHGFGWHDVQDVSAAMLEAFGPGRNADEEFAAAPEVAHKPILDRAVRLLSGVDVNQEVGLEIGPLDIPLVVKGAGRQIFYADYTTQEVLKHQSTGNPHVNIDNIPFIDYVLGGSLPEKLDRDFDYIIASHVAEHVPDFLGWVTAMFGWLKPGGRIILAIPDKRHCFDVLRPPSSAGQLMEAFFERRTCPKFSSVYDGMRQAVHFDNGRAWNDPSYEGPFEPMISRDFCFATARRALEPGVYQDCHCWVFTYDTFMEVIAEINALGVAPMKILRHEAPVHGANEFHVVLGPKTLLD